MQARSAIVANLTPLRLAGALALAELVEASASCPPAVWGSIALGAGLAWALLLHEPETPWADILAALVAVAANRLLHGAWTLSKDKPPAVALHELNILLVATALLLLARCAHVRRDTPRGAAQGRRNSIWWRLPI